MNNQNNLHQPVLLNEVIKLLNIKPDGIYVDCTAGYGGHSCAILSRLNIKGKLICIDQDQKAIAYLTKLWTNDQRVILIHDNFNNLKQILARKGIKQVDGILADLGVSSPMFDEAERGFSYHVDNKLDMRMNQSQELDAHFIINNYDSQQLQQIFRQYGEVHNPRQVVNAITQYRKRCEIKSTLELVKIIKDALPTMVLHKQKHPARQYFQALRIAVNNELDNLSKLLQQALTLIKIYGRVVIISFHSLEDRIVKKAFSYVTHSQIPKEIPIMDQNINFKSITHKPITAATTEITTNRRSRSAKLRVVEKIKE